MASRNELSKVDEDEQNSSSLTLSMDIFLYVYELFFTLNMTFSSWSLYIGFVIFLCAGITYKADIAEFVLIYNFRHSIASTPLIFFVIDVLEIDSFGKLYK